MTKSKKDLKQLFYFQTEVLTTKHIFKVPGTPSPHSTLPGTPIPTSTLPPETPKPTPICDAPPMTRGDEVDNDCDGAVDEENCDGTGTDGEGILFFVCCQNSNSRIVCFYGDVVIFDEVLQNLGGIFIVLNLL